MNKRSMIIPPADRLQQLQEYYFSVKLKEIQQMREAGHQVINLGIGSPDLMPSEETIEALCRSAHAADSHGYQPYQGLLSLRQAIARWYARTYGVTLNAATEVLPLLGSKEGITHISMAFLNPGDEVLVPELGYPAYSAVTRMVGAQVKTYPLLEAQQWQPDLEALWQQDYSRVKIMWLNYPHMPTGAAPQRSVFEQLVRLAKEKQLLLCHDNPYSLVLNLNQPMSLLSVEGASEVAIEINSLSKSHNMAGWRIGWIAGQQAYLNAIIKIKSNMDSGMFKPVQEAAIQALENSDQWHSERNRIYETRRHIVYRMLNALGCTYSSEQQGMFVWAKLPANAGNAEKWADILLQQKHVFITPGSIFGEKGQNYIRISLCSSESMLNQALERITRP